MKNFKDKVIWITGASSGFGEALAYEFNRYGTKLILSARREKELNRVKEKLDQVVIISFDLSKRSSFAEKTTEALNAFGHIDMIVHCGGIAQNGSALQTKSEVQRKIMDIDFFSYTEITQLLLPHFLDRNSGQIVVVSGVLASVGLPNRSSYSAAKAALHGYFNCLRTEMVNNNITVTILVPGTLNTTLTSKALSAQGEIAGNVTNSKGCSVEEAAKQAVEAIYEDKFEVYIGNFNKGKLLYLMSRYCPSMAVRKVLKQFKK